jgi:FdhD protein
MRRQADEDERASPDPTQDEARPTEGAQEEPQEAAREDVTATVRLTRLRDGQRAEVEDAVAREQTLHLFVGGRPLLRLQCLPAQVEDLALGLLLTSGLLKPEDPAPPVEYQPENGEAHVAFEPSEERIAALQESMTLGSGCGAALSPVSGFDPMDCTRRIDTSFRIAPDAIARAMTTFVQRSEIFRATGGVHAAAIAREDAIVAFAEDIGRHNAFDKVIGACYRRGIEMLDKIALVTGRLSLEIVAKAVPSSLPVLVSRGAPTSAAVELAENANLTLIGFARSGRMNIYTAEWRIT